MEFEISLDKRFNFIHRCDVVIFQIILDIFINNFFFWCKTRVLQQRHQSYFDAWDSMKIRSVNSNKYRTGK